MSSFVSVRTPLKMAGYCLALALSSAGGAEERPVNAAGYPTISLAEAGLSVMPPHPASGTSTSPACARTVRREGQTVRTDPSSQLFRCQRSREANAASQSER
ncbi:hypothetical protein [Rhizorhabdus dicambivorans]|uniref:Uncharacterized protein n=1 Tax=Rhizorhabdus dicambivorans TaxID=1850238 RepID=A0A2A4G1Q5_9SPHN|nr:hypothetical protein [Rhizorhabdus dicambivorans]ATE66584.1 hypothetical protein CMV14_21005 [Rhizorhabdus dicambivorans]PCE43933.1 hypothetical protein COO09_03145 [Rhizorhabdus dicambivorans]